MVTVANGFSLTPPKLRVLESRSNPKNAITFSFTKNRKRNLNFYCRCTSSWDWNKWISHVSHIEKVDNYVSHLQSELDEAVDLEHYNEAARLKKAIDAATSDDVVAQIMSQLKSCVDDERYYDASTLCTLTRCGLVGWWVGYTKDSDDPVGRIIRISPGVGRFIAESYTPRQLLSESRGTPIFEIYVVKNDDGTYQMQVVHLQQPKRKTKSKPEKSDEILNPFEEKTKESIENVVCFLEDKIPGFEMNVMNINVEEEEGDDSITNLMQEDSIKATSSKNSTEEEVHDEGTLETDSDASEEEVHDEGTLETDSDASEEENDSDSDPDMNLFVGEVFPIDNDTPVKDKFIRLPAELQDIEEKSFVLHIPERNGYEDIVKPKMHEIYKAALAAKDLLDRNAPETVDALYLYKNTKIETHVQEMIKCAINKAHMRGRILSEYASFSRITSPIDDSDPFDGVYVGSFGAFGSQIVQLKRKFGNWNNVSNNNICLDTEDFEYVEAVKLTGDLLVPAGEVTFRAKIGRDNNDNYCDRSRHILGVGSTYEGQGRVADFGFKNPRWVDGKLLMVDKDRKPKLKGAKMGFHFTPLRGRHLLVPLHRLKLPSWLQE